MKNLRGRIFSIIGLNIFVLTVLTIGSVTAQKIRDTPVTTNVSGTGVQADPGAANYRIQSDLLGPYKNGIDAVESIIQTSFQPGDWIVNTLSSAKRSLLLDLRDPVTTTATLPFSYAQVPTRIIVKGHLTSATSFGQMTGLGTTFLAPMYVRFEFARSTYHLTMDHDPSNGTDYVLVTCTGVVDPLNPATSRCNQWRIEPSVTQADGQRKNIARLVRDGKAGSVDTLGDFYMSFTFSVNNP
jgi:hypothetical protein